MLRALRDIIQKYSSEEIANYCYNEISDAGIIRLTNYEEDLIKELECAGFQVERHKKHITIVI